jgi:hypothetical protein
MAKLLCRAMLPGETAADMSLVSSTIKRRPRSNDFDAVLFTSDLVGVLVLVFAVALLVRAVADLF